MIDIATVGWLTMDDIVLLDHSCRPGVLGGGALYSAIGAQIWSESVGVHSVTGREVYEDVRTRIAARGLDGEGVGAIDGAGLQLWLLHESETFKRQVPKLNSATAEDMDRGRGPLPEAYRRARGFHVAPQSPEGTTENVRDAVRAAASARRDCGYSFGRIHRPPPVRRSRFPARRVRFPSERAGDRADLGAVGHWRMAARDRVAPQMPYGREARRAWISRLRRRERRLDPYASAPGRILSIRQAPATAIAGASSRVSRPAGRSPNALRWEPCRRRMLSKPAERSKRNGRATPLVRRGYSACLRRPDMRIRKAVHSHAV